MSQNWQSIVGGDNLKASRTLIQNMLDTLRSMWSGATLASDTVAHQLAHETTTDTVCKRNAADSAWVVHGIGEERFWGLDKYAPKPAAVTLDAESSDMIRSHVVIEDRGGTDLDGTRHVVEVWVSATEYGAPSATGNTLAVNDGTVLETLTSNAHLRVIRPASGDIEIDLTVSGAATRFLHVLIPNAPIVTKELTFAA